jgi:GTP cyclohydrolase I
MSPDTAVSGPGLLDPDLLVRGARLIVQGLGLDPDAEEIAETPARVARMYQEMASCMGVDPGSVIDVQFKETYDEMVIVRDIPFASLCEHHLLPFVGRAHVGYLPNGEGHVTGLSKLARVVESAARRPGLQERMTESIANALEHRLQPRGVIVVVEAEHMCMTVRGIRKPGSTTVTSAVRGSVREDARTRAEAMALIHGR